MQRHGMDLISEMFRKMAFQTKQWSHKLSFFKVFKIVTVYCLIMLFLWWHRDEVATDILLALGRSGVLVLFYLLLATTYSKSLIRGSSGRRYVVTIAISNNLSSNFMVYKRLYLPLNSMHHTVSQNSMQKNVSLYMDRRMWLNLLSNLSGGSSSVSGKNFIFNKRLSYSLVQGKYPLLWIKVHRPVRVFYQALLVPLGSTRWLSSKTRSLWNSEYLTSFSK